jgi:hypothetical protein
MKIKSILLTALATLGLTSATIAQTFISSYTNQVTNGWSHIFNVVPNQNYKLTISGEFSMGGHCPNFNYDPAYQIITGIPQTWLCGEGVYIQGYCNNNLGIRPIPDLYNLNHSYDYYITPDSNTISVGFYDDVYSDNCGTIFFSLYQLPPPCILDLTITPQINSISIGSNATFSAITSDSNASYLWQSDFGQGFQTLNNFGNYSGANTATLNIANIQLPNHTQPIRVITTSGNCIDTSNVAVINILDTCITNVTVYDTLLTTVTDTLVINATITGLNPPNNLNTIKVFPNPTNDHITINYGNFASMSGYTLKIVNSVGQTVYTTPINQQTSYVDLSTWTGNGIYFVQLIDPQNNTIENRKIVIQ